MRSAGAFFQAKKRAFLEGTFLSCRIVLTYAGAVVFLALPIVVRLTQEFALFVQDSFPELSVPQHISEATRAEVMRQALSVVWLGGQKGTLLTQDEYMHLLDVHWLFIGGAVGVGCAVCWAIMIEKNVARLWVAKIYRRLSLGVVGVSFVGWLFFEELFMVFHRLAFPQGNYAFPVESLLIQSFPPVLWLLNFFLLQAGVAVLFWFQAHHAEQVGI